MIYRWVKIDITQRSDITEPGTFTIASPRLGSWLGVVKLFMTIEGANSYSRDLQLFFGDEAVTGILDVSELRLDLDLYHEVLSEKLMRLLRSSRLAKCSRLYFGV